MIFRLLVGFFLLQTATAINGAVIAFEFDAPVAGTILDKNGQGTGFTHRLPGSGSNYPFGSPDPNLDIITKPGHLLFQSTRSDINQLNGFGRNLAAMDAPGIFLQGIGTKDFSATARFNNVQVPGLSDQLLIYAGTSVNNVVRAGFHEAPGAKGDFIIGGNQGSFDFGFPTTISGPTNFDLGDDIVLTLARTSSSWSLEWENLTNPSGSGSYTNVSIPWLDTEPDLYVGLMHMDARNFSSQVAEIGYFRVTVVPEPSTFAMFGILSFAMLVLRLWTQRIHS